MLRQADLGGLQSALPGQSLDLFDLHPPQWPVEDLPQRVRLPSEGRSVIEYRLHPDQRGHARFEGCALRLHSPWRLWTRLRSLSIVSDVRIYPDFARVSHLALVGTDRASRVIGAHQHRRRGEGTEFHQLREYRTGDSLREAMLDELIEQHPERVYTALEASAAALCLEQRKRVHTALRAQGATVLDVTAAELPGALVDHYLAMKRAGRL